MGKLIGRALLGLLAGLLLSAVNLAGAALTVLALGGLGPWSTWQFIGLVAVAEVATGIAFILCPAIWQLPVTYARGEPLPGLCPRSLLRPHWAASPKVVAGLALLVAVIARTGIAPTAALLAPLAVASLAAVCGISLLAARLGTAFPAADVVTVVIQRPSRPARALPTISLAGAVVQLLVNVGAFPLVKVSGPQILFQPRLAPSLPLLGWSAVAGGLLLLGGVAVWSGDLRPRAGARQPPDEMVRRCRRARRTRTERYAPPVRRR